MSTQGTNPSASRDAASIDTALQRGAVLVTPHARAAQQFAARYDAARKAEAAKLWQPGNILPWRAWTTSLWREAQVSGAESRVVLNGLQERALWENLLRTDDATGLRPAASIARLCASATALLGAWDTTNLFGRDAFSGDGASPDTAHFARWFASFIDRCLDGSYLPLGFVDRELSELFREHKLVSPGEVILYGFHKLTPAQEMLVATLQASGTDVVRVEATSSPQQAPQVIRCDNPLDEAEQCARWLRQTLDANPSARIAVVVPDLHACRPQLERTFRAVVAPELSDVLAAPADAPFTFAGGRPLTQLPLVADALSLLRWCAGETSLEEAGILLRSRSLALAPTPERGAELDATVLRRAIVLRGEISMQRLAAMVGKHDEPTGDKLREVALLARDAQSREDTYAYFADTARKLLRAAGWAQSNDGMQASDQASQLWEEALDRTSTLDLVHERIRFQQFLNALTTAVQETSFSPANTQATVQILKPEEAVSESVDALWFLHCDEATWPPRTARHPLLPWSLQNALGMPGSDFARDEAGARRLLQRLVQNAASANFSYAAHLPEGAQRPSALLESITGIIRIEAAPTSTSAEVAVQIEAVEDLSDLPHLPDAKVPGGTGVLTAQAQCGFRAMAEHRLFSVELEQRDAGFLQSDRGKHVHEVLQKFWDTVKTHEELRRLARTVTADGRSERDALLTTLIADTLSTNTSHPWETAYLEVQAQRLFRLVGEWLDREAERPPFAVLHTELTVPGAAVGPLRLDLRVDRIDAVESTEPSAVLIDYKTGRVQRADWIGERLDAPQLPVYAVAGSIENVRGIAFATVRVGKDGMKFEDMLDSPALLGSSTRGKKDFDFQQQLETWRHDLERLATAYANGEAAVDPKDHITTCKHCANRLFCRLDLALLEPDDDLQEEDLEEVLL